MKLPGYKRLIKEDFKSEEQDLVNKLAFIVNSGFEPVYAALSKGLTITDNFNQQTQDIVVKVNAGGSPINTIQIRYLLKSSCIGITAINCTPAPPSAPWITWEQTGNGLVAINKITGLVANTEYRVKLVLFGA